MKADASFLQILKAHRQWVSVVEVCKTLQKAGHLAFLAGGCVRDALMGRIPNDFDIATSATPDQIEACFERTIAVGKQFGVIIVRIGDSIKNEVQVEVATFRSDGAYIDGRRPDGVTFSDPPTDAARRDFTVNALFYDPIENEIHDYVDGVKDLQAKVIRAVGEPDRRFTEDRLRILRALRFQSQLGFSIDPETRNAIKPLAQSIGLVSRERIRDEIDKLISGRGAEQALKDLADVGLAKPIFGEWADALFPSRYHGTGVGDLDVRRLLFFWPALSQAPRDRAREILQDWKYGRAFTDLAVWAVANQKRLRSPNNTVKEDPVETLVPREVRVARFSFSAMTDAEFERIYAISEIEWMQSLELWMDEKAVRACAAFDSVLGYDRKRDEALHRRGVWLGHPWLERPTAADLQAYAAARGFSFRGPDLGRQLKWLTRDLLLFSQPSALKI